MIRSKTYNKIFSVLRYSLEWIVKTSRVFIENTSPSGHNRSTCFLWNNTTFTKLAAVLFKWPLLISDLKKKNTFGNDFESKRQLVIFKSVHIFKPANTEQLSLSDSDSTMKPADYYDNKRSHAWNMVEITFKLYIKHTLTCCYNVW